jgi:hypothetical protein
MWAKVPDFPANLVNLLGKKRPKMAKPKNFTGRQPEFSRQNLKI